MVLLAGLAGDVETETAYKQHLQDWLDWLGSVAPALRQVCVFWDGPATPAPALQCPVRMAASSRSEWLALAGKLVGETNPLVVVVWGHGGFQGKTPVFHVRGPRLTAADFKLAAGSGQRSSTRWVLCFRGSGRFARELLADATQVLSSDLDTIFQSDPVAMGLLVKGLSSTGSGSFRVVAEGLGRQVEGWYLERRLVRQEEPTLWLPGLEPLRLVTAEGRDSFASVPAEDDSPPARPPVPLPELPGELPSAWTGLARVKPQEYPDAEAVILRRRLAFTLARSPALTSEHEEFVQVLTAAGQGIGDFDLTYSPPQEELNLLDCEVLLPEGRLVRLGREEVRESGEAPIGDYPTGRRKYFALPGVVPGAVLHVRYRREWQHYPMPHVMLSLPISQPMPVVDQTLQLTVPKDSAFHFAFDQMAAIQPTVQQTAYGSSYVWSFTNLPAVRPEVLTAPGRESALLVSTWPDWAAFAEWYGRIVRKTDELTPALSEKARELTRDSRTDMDKVKALYNYVTGLRYVMVPLGVNSFRPHAAARVLENRFGDCKDKANLFNALLHALGYEAHLVLVPRFSQVNEAVPGLAFNHALSRVRLGAETLWLDTTDDVCRFGMLPPGDAGRRVLVVEEQNTALTELPLPAARDHRLELDAELQWPSPDAAASLSLKATARGFPDYELRQTAGRSPGRRAPAPLLAASWRLSTGALSLEKQDHTPVFNLDQDFSWQARGQVVGLVSAAGTTKVLRAPFWVPKEWDLVLHPRRHPLFLNHGYPLTLRENITMVLPAAVNQVSLPPGRENEKDPLRWRIEWTRVSERAVRVELRLELARGELDAAETRLLQEQLRALLTALGDGATFAETP